jgi:hypothetical protein
VLGYVGTLKFCSDCMCTIIQHYAHNQEDATHGAKFSACSNQVSTVGTNLVFYCVQESKRSHVGWILEDLQWL